MRPLRAVVPLVALFLVLGLAPRAQAQNSKKVTGTLTAMAADSVTVKVAGADMNFMVDDKVHVEAPGAGTRTRQAAAQGARPKLSELLKAGDPVEISYTESGGSRHATEIRKVSSAGSGGVPSNSATGTVTSVSATSLSISGSGGGGSTFAQTYVIDGSTKVVGRGAGTAAAKAGGKIAITDVVATGDHVAVSYKSDGAALKATEVRVTAKGEGKK
jgi:uncharacterized protein DUF5666